MRLAVLCALALLAPGSLDAAGGAALFAARCAVCHKTRSSPAAPSLLGVFGRRIASLPDFSYSAALKAKAPGRWNAASLSAFLAGPSAFAPGTKMFVGPLAPGDRAAIIAYLSRLKG